MKLSVYVFAAALITVGVSAGPGDDEVPANTNTNTWRQTNEETYTNGDADPVSRKTHYDQDDAGNLQINGQRPQTVWDVADAKLNQIFEKRGLERRGGTEGVEGDEWVDVAGGKGNVNKNTFSSSNSNIISGTGKKPVVKDHTTTIDGNGFKVDGKDPFVWKRDIGDEDVGISGLKNKDTNTFTNTFTTSNTFNGNDKKPITNTYSIGGLGPAGSNIDNGNFKVNGKNPFKWRRGLKNTNKNTFTTSSSNTINNNGKKPEQKDHSVVLDNGAFKVDGKDLFGGKGKKL
ncbi:hypothetical protein HK097_009932 [Rhizophlyctis rosea]|uniref:Uncharacterized protein n=1 Tax=Rhizophlyctis rosea TaxID=64517 RepID=A0AAD5SLP0_9FUNG|nr:hypothetical protein HK097_009932 [Rhizophlyctis rosea]